MVAAVGHRAAFVARRYNERLGELSQMQHIAPALIRIKTADQHDEGAAVGRGIGELPIRAVTAGAFHQRKRRTVQV